MNQTVHFELNNFDGLYGTQAENGHSQKQASGFGLENWESGVKKNMGGKSYDVNGCID